MTIYNHFDTYPASQLKVGMVLRNGEVITDVTTRWDETVVTTDKGTHTYNPLMGVQTNVPTNCLYGGNSMGHSHGGFCTADACY